jgi:hypothetical protein
MPRASSDTATPFFFASRFQCFIELLWYFNLDFLWLRSGCLFLGHSSYFLWLRSSRAAPGSARAPEHTAVLPCLDVHQSIWDPVRVTLQPIQPPSKRDTHVEALHLAPAVKTAVCIQDELKKVRQNRLRCIALTFLNQSKLLVSSDRTANLRGDHLAAGSVRAI